MRYLKYFSQQIRALVKSGRLDRDDELRLADHIRRLRHDLSVHDAKGMKEHTEALCTDLIDALKTE